MLKVNDELSVPSKTITSISFDELTSKIKILFSDDTFVETGALPIGEASSFPSAVAIDLSSTSANFDPVLKDAFHDFLGMLPEITAGTNLTIVPNDGGTGSVYTRIDGKILRFFNRTLVDVSDGVYTIKDATADIVDILPQEAYSLIWNASGSKWTVIPGIINVKTRPSGFVFEDIPSTFTQPDPEAPAP